MEKISNNTFVRNNLYKGEDIVTLIIIGLLFISTHIPYTYYYQAEINLIHLVLITFVLLLSGGLWNGCGKLQISEKILLLFSGYLIINGLMLNRSVTPLTYTILHAVLLLFGLKAGLKYRLMQILGKNLIYLSACLVFLELVVCIFQYKGVMVNPNPRYNLGGISGHPGYSLCTLAILIAMVVPTNIFQRRLSGLVLLCYMQIIILLILSIWLQSRVSIITLAVVLGYCWFEMMKKHKKYIVYFLVVGVFLLCILTILKLDSSLGRMSIWYNCIYLLIQAPVFGHGFGGFISVYNDYQRNLISQKSIMPITEYSSEYIKMAYNDFIEVGVETGLVGIGLIVMLFVSLIRLKKLNGKVEQFFNPWYGVISLLILMLTWPAIKYPYFLNIMVLLVVLSGKSYDEITSK